MLLIHGAGANVVALRDAAGLVFIDGGLKANQRTLLELAQQQLGKGSLQRCINTHWHPEHTGLNEHARQTGREDHRAREHAPVAFDHGALHSRMARPSCPCRSPRAPMPPPTTPVNCRSATKRCATATCSQAHTDGDLYVKFAKANVLVTGGVVAGNGWPTADWVTGGWINGTVGGYRTLIAQCDDKTRVVTAQGDTTVHARPTCRPSSTCWRSCRISWAR